MKRGILFIVLVFASCLFAFSQAQYDEEHEGESFSLNTALSFNKSYHYKASERIVLGNGFSYAPSSGKKSLFEIDEMMLFPPTFGTAISTTVEPDVPLNPPPGLPYSLPMTTDVNDNGAAVITIPIDCPYGANGLNPNLSFVYNSQAGDGIMGPGWSIGGMSKISRVPYKYYYSNYSNAVSFSQEDDYSIDGNRLLKGSNNEYYPEVFDNTVVKYIQSNNSFVVEKPNGYVYTYGGTSNSKHYVKGISSNPIEWHLSSIQDPFGNTINYSYSIDDDGGFYPACITYCEDSIKFEYYNYKRSDTQKKFFVDKLNQKGYSKINKTLFKLSFKHGNDAVHLYSLSYLPQGDIQNSELVSIQKIGTNNEVGNRSYSENCTASCQFVWCDSIGVLQDESMGNDVLLGIDYNVSSYYNQEKVFAARFPESIYEGLSDMVILLKHGVHPYYKMVALRNNSAGNSSYGFISIPCNAANDNLGDHDNYYLFAPVDVDGDGYNEILYTYKDNTSQFHAILIQYDETTNAFKCNNVTIDSAAPNNSNNPYEFHIGDFDGNGCSDLLMTNGKFLRVYLSINGAFDKTIRNPYSYDLYGDALRHREYVGDFTGDGRDQLISMFKNTNSSGYRARKVCVTKDMDSLTLRISADYYPAMIQHLADSLECKHLCQGDFNGDNKQDFVAIMQTTENHNWYFYLSKGDGYNFEQKIWANETSYSDIESVETPIPADFNGDGCTDLNITRKEVEYYPPNQLNSQQYYFYYRYNYLIRVDDSIPKVIRKRITDNNGEEQYAGMTLYGSTSINLSKFVMTCIGNFRGTSPCEVAYTTLSFGGREGDMKDGRYALYLRMWNTGDFDHPPLKAIVMARNGLGASTRFDYTQHSNQALYQRLTDRNPQINFTKRFTQHLNVVKKMRIETDEGVSRDILYYFRQPVMHTRGKGFLGFMMLCKVVECHQNQSSDIIGTDRYFNLHDTYYIIYPNETRIHHNGTLINKYEYTYDFLNLRQTYSGMPQNVFMPVLTKEDNENSTNGTRTTTVLSQFDGYGNPTNTSKTIRTTNPTTQKYINTNRYTYENIIGNGRRFIGLVNSCNDIHVLGNNSITISTSYYYDNCGFMTRKVCNGVDERFTRDSHGNITRIDRIADNQTRSETMTYSNNGRLLTSHTDAMGNTTYYQYINRNGLLRSETDPNGLVTTYHYDMLGNVTNIEHPDGTREMFVKRWTIPLALEPYVEHPDKPETGNPVYYTWSKRSGQPETTSFFDQHDRLLRKVTTDYAGRKIYQDYTYYYKSGLLFEEYLPRFSTDAQASGKTIYTYDYLDRITSISKPGYNKYVHHYNGNTETITGFDGITKVVKYMPNKWPQQVTDNGTTTIEYSYYGDGKIMSTKVGGDNATKIEYTYDAYRHPRTIADPSLGRHIYSYNAFGELVSDTNNRMQATTYLYDALGRMISRTDSDGTSTWQYDQQMAGLLDNVVYEPTDTDEPEVVESFEYDCYGRLIRQEQSLDNESQPLVFSYGYNQHGHRTSITYPSGHKLSYIYDKNGTMTSVKNSSDGSTLWSMTETDKFGNITEFTLGDNINISRAYHVKTSLVTSLTATKNGTIQNLQYSWDPYGNLTNRTDNVTMHSESFTYDSFNRLTDIETDAHNSCEICYDNLGNVSDKCDAGTMRYSMANPYAVTRLSNVPDITLFNDTQGVTYTSFDKAKSVSQGAKALSINYGADRQRVLQTLGDGSDTKTKRYFTPLFEVVTEDGTTKKLHYLTSSTGLFAIFALDSNNNGTMSYVIKDHQGSMYATVTGNTVERYNFDAWGRRRNPQTLSYDNVSTSFDRGYTLHEHYDDFGLINMNGRLYDPLVARMLSPDIVIQDEQNSQAYNRYSYCFNNPLRYTDPSGYIITIPPEFEDYYYPELIGNYEEYQKKLEKAGAMNVNIYNTDESEGKTISWNANGKNYEMIIVDHHLKDYKQICENSCVADAFAAQEKRLNGNNYLTPETIMSWKINSCEDGYKIDKIIPLCLKESNVYRNILDYSDMVIGLEYYEKRAFIEMNRNCGVFFNFYNENINGHVINATTATQFKLDNVLKGHEIRIWDSGIDNNGNVEGYKSLLFYDLNKLYGKFGVFHIKK